jgi:hypothetical protein
MESGEGRASLGEMFATSEAAGKRCSATGGIASSEGGWAAPDSEMVATDEGEMDVGVTAAPGCEP